MPASRRTFTHAARHRSSVPYRCSNSASVSPCMIAGIDPIPYSPDSILHRFCGGRKGADWLISGKTKGKSNLQNHADSVIFRLKVCGFRETPASVSWYDGVAKRPDTDEDNKDAGDVAEGDTIHILAPYSRRTSALAR